MPYLKKEKAFRKQKNDGNILPNSRLAVDQFNLIRQIQIACDTAKLGAARLAGKEDTAPKHEGNEATISELQDRTNSVLDYLSGFTQEDFVAAETQKITQPRWEGKYLNGLEYAIEHAIPNIYFHVTTSCAILRHNGVDIGKKDYLGAMPYKS